LDTVMSPRQLVVERIKSNNQLMPRHADLGAHICIWNENT
jgi:hypothetical protein